MTKKVWKIANRPKRKSALSRAFNGTHTEVTFGLQAILLILVLAVSFLGISYGYWSTNVANQGYSAPQPACQDGGIFPKCYVDPFSHIWEDAIPSQNGNHWQFQNS